MKHNLIVTLLMALFACSACSAQKVDNAPTTAPFILDKYPGSWYEIARFDHVFERGLSHSRVQYAIRSLKVHLWSGLVKDPFAEKRNNPVLAGYHVES